MSFSICTETPQADYRDSYNWQIYQQMQVLPASILTDVETDNKSNLFLSESNNQSRLIKLYYFFDS